MKVVKPYNIDSSVLVNSTILDDADGYPEWDAARDIPEKIIASGEDPFLCVYERQENQLFLSQTIKNSEDSFFSGQVTPIGRRNFMHSGYGPVNETALYGMDKDGVFSLVSGGITHQILSTETDYGGNIFASAYFYMSPHFSWFRFSDNKLEQLPVPAHIEGIKIGSVAVSSDGKKVAISQIGVDYSFRLYEIDGLDLVFLYEYSVPSGNLSPVITRVCFSKDSTLVAYAYYKSVVIVDTNTYETLFLSAVKSAHSEPVNTTKMSFSPDGRFLALPGGSGLVVLKRDSGSWTTALTNSSPSTDCSWNANSSYLYVSGGTGSVDTGITVYSIDDGVFTESSNSVNSGDEMLMTTGICTMDRITGYLRGETVFRGTNLFEVAVASTMVDPVYGEGYGTPQWLNIGKINKWRMFDDKTNSFSSAEDEITVVLRPDELGADHVCLFGLDATSVVFSILEDPVSTTKWTSEVVLNGKTSLIMPLGEEVLAGEKIKIEIKKPGGTAVCGKCFFGKAETIGSTQWGIEVGVDDKSKEVEDGFGYTSVRQGAWAKPVTASAWIDNGVVDTVYRAIVGIRGTACGWDFNGDSTDYSLMNAYGLAKNVRVVMQGPNQKLMKLEIKGFI